MAGFPFGGCDFLMGSTISSFKESCAVTIFLLRFDNFGGVATAAAAAGGVTVFNGGGTGVGAAFAFVGAVFCAGGFLVSVTSTGGVFWIFSSNLFAAAS